MPKGYPAKPKKALIEASPELATLEQYMLDLKARIKLARSRSGKRLSLVGYCKRNDLNRADLTWVISQLPKTRLTRKDRLEAAKEKKSK
jgi:hypothetical protein